jgi:hypothetical protein
LAHLLLSSPRLEGGQIDIANGSSGNGYQNLIQGDSFLLPRNVINFQYRAESDIVNSPFSGNFVIFNTFDCAGGTFELDVGDQFCEVTFTGIPPASENAPNCGGQIDIANGSSGNDYQNLIDGSTILLPRNVAGLQWRAETDVVTSPFSGPFTVFDTLNCDSGSKSIDASSAFCTVLVKGVPTNPTCGGQIDIANGSSGNGYQNLREGAEIIFPSDISGLQWRAETDIVTSPFSSAFNSFDTIGCNAGTIELDVSGSFCLVTFTGVPTGSDGMTRKCSSVLKMEILKRISRSSANITLCIYTYRGPWTDRCCKWKLG